MNRPIRTVDSLITGPTVEPLDLDEVKKHLRFGSTTEDSLLDVWISSARQEVERRTGRQLITATWEYWLDELPAGPIELPHPPLQSVVSMMYVDSTGSLVSFSEGVSPDVPFYSVNAPQGPFASRGRISPNYGSSWPTPQNSVGAVRIRYIAGYGDTPGDVPEVIKKVLYLFIARDHKFRSNVVDGKSPMEVPGAETIIRELASSALPQLTMPSVDDSLLPTWIPAWLV